MNIGMIGMAAALGLSASGSALGTGTASLAAVGGWKKRYANGKPAPFPFGCVLWRSINTNNLRIFVNEFYK
jgi:hypothetical protein